MQTASDTTPAQEGARRTWTGRIRAAYSLRENLRRLWVPPASTIAPLDGIRAFAILWVATFHVYFFTGPFLDRPSIIALASNPHLRLVWCGDLGVDAFFVLSGFLIS